tara:strand:+ start:20054 stop:20377 length:324 start_codon:yes stop_codon:yes gene_type:complete
MAFNIKQNDTSPQIAATLKDGSGNARDITGASVRFHMRRIGAASASVTSDATILVASAGTVKYAWQTGDTSTAGSFQAEFQVTFADGGIETFPNDGSIAIDITPELA